MFKQRVYKKGHPLANSIGEIRKSRYVLYEKLEGIPGNCHWCKSPLTWKTVCADHLDSNIMNDVPENLVASCRACNANREDGTGYGRRTQVACKKCGSGFLPRSRSTKYCSLICCSQDRQKRGSKAKHGTRSRYTYGCRCKLCKDGQSNDYKKWYYRNR